MCKKKLPISHLTMLSRFLWPAIKHSGGPFLHITGIHVDRYYYDDGGEVTRSRRKQQVFEAVSGGKSDAREKRRCD